MEKNSNNLQCLNVTMVNSLDEIDHTLLPFIEETDDNEIDRMLAAYDEDRMIVPYDEGFNDVDSLLDQALDALDEKKGSAREKALSSIIEILSSDVRYELVEEKFDTLLHQCLDVFKKGSRKASAKEIALASHAMGLLALTVGCYNNMACKHAREIYEESVLALEESLKTSELSDVSMISSLVRCLAIITFVGGNDDEETEESMDMMWRLINPKLDYNVAFKFKPSPSLVTAVVSAWSFLLSTMDNLKLNSKSWQNSITYLSNLLNKKDRSLQAVAGEALAIIFEIGVKEEHNYQLKKKFIDQVKDIFTKAGGKCSKKRNLNKQRDLFLEISKFFENDCSPTVRTKIGSDSLRTSSWCHLTLLNFLKNFMGDGFIKHMQKNKFFHLVLGFKPQGNQGFVFRENLNDNGAKKKNFNSWGKSRCQKNNKKWFLHEHKNFGHAFDEEA